jgi:hypothetical protein
VGAFMMLARKWDRLEKAAKDCGWDIFKCADNDERSESVLDDIRDLRRYLILVEAEVLAGQLIEKAERDAKQEATPA